MRLILTADWHLTNRPQDEYRWAIFDAIGAAALKYQVDGIVNLGDLTHFKDGHNAAMVTRLFAAMKKLAAIRPVWILQGNHDYVDRKNAFFSVLGYAPNVAWIDSLYTVNMFESGKSVLFLPHEYDPTEAWKDEKIQERITKADLIFIHQPLEGASSGGHAIESPLKASYFRDLTAAKVFAGDIHAPQTLGQVEYVGSPHPVDFGDNYETRFLLWDDGKVTPIKHKTINKAIAVIREFSDLGELDLYQGDQLKIIYELHRSQFDEWKSRRDEVTKACQDVGIDLYSIELKSLTQNRMRLLRGGESVRVISPVDLVKKFGANTGVDPEFVEEGVVLSA